MENKTFEYKLPSTQSISLILTFCSISALFLYLVYSKNLVFGSESGGWVYEYFESINPTPLWIPITVLLLTGLLIYVCGKLIESYEKVTLLACFFLAIAIQILMYKIYPHPLDQVIKSDYATSFYTPALQYSPADILSQYLILAKGFVYHARTNMPGKILFFSLLKIFTISPQVMGYIIISISTLGGLLLYGICKILFHDKTLAFYSFVLYILIPSKIFFLPVLNSVTPVFILACMYLFLIYLNSKNKFFLMLLGISLFFLALFEPSPFITGILFLGILLHAIGQKKVSIKELVPIILVPTLSFLAIYLLLYLFFSFNLWQAFHYVITDAITFNAEAKRSYVIWLKENLKEFFFGAGLPTMMIFIYFVINILSQWKVISKNILSLPIEIVYVLSLILTFCVALFLGINRGETTRLWIYLAVFFQIPVAFFMAKVVKNNTLFFILSGTLITQSIIILQRVSFIAP